MHEDTYENTHTHTQSVLADPNSGIGKGSKKKKGGGGIVHHCKKCIHSAVHLHLLYPYWFYCTILTL